MPRDPKDTSTTSSQRVNRRLAETEDQKDPIRLRVGAGPAGAEGKEGPAGPAGPAGSAFPIARGTVATSLAAGSTSSAVITVTHGLGAKPTFVGISPELGEGTIAWGVRIIERTATQFKFQLNTSAALGALTNVTVLWFAA